MSKLLPLALLLTLFGAGCIPDPVSYHDEEKHATCWTHGPAIDCIPDEQLPKASTDTHEPIRFSAGSTGFAQTGTSTMAFVKNGDVVLEGTTVQWVELTTILKQIAK